MNGPEMSVEKFLVLRFGAVSFGELNREILAWRCCTMTRGTSLVGDGGGWWIEDEWRLCLCDAD